MNGVILVPTDPTEGTVRVLSQPAPNPPTYPNSAIAPVPTLAWDLTTGKQVYVKIQPALGYTWGTGDTLQPNSPLTSTSAPAPSVAAGPVGNPVGGQSFIMWQQGSIVVDSPATDPSCGSNLTTFAPYLSITLSPSSGVWSPDGQLFFPRYVGVNGRFDTAVRPSALANVGPCGGGGPPSSLPLLPVRDAALSAVLTRWSASDVSVAWSQDGQRLLLLQTVLPSYTSAASSPRSYSTVSIYACASGKVLATLDAPTLEPKVLADRDIKFTVALWSPNRAHLLLIDPSNHAVVEVNASALGG